MRRGCKMNQEFSSKPVKFEIFGRHPGRGRRGSSMVTVENRSIKGGN